MSSLPITDTVGVLAALSGICAFCFWIEKATQWKLFQLLPPLIFIYLVPVILTNQGVLPATSPVYDVMQQVMLPMFLVLLLIKVNVRGAFRIMGRGVGVMLFGTLGVMIGAPLGCLAVRTWLGPETWKSFGALSGSWIGGTGNLAAVGTMVEANGAQVGLAVLADSTIYMIWLPILLGSKRFADRFDRFTGVAADRVEQMEQAAEELQETHHAPTTRDYLFLICAALAAIWVANLLAGILPAIDPYLTQSTWQVLLITTIGLALSYTPLHHIPGSQELAMALLYLFVAKMGASARLEEVREEAVPFLLGAGIMILVHGIFCVVGARLFKTDLHTAAIASAANIGGAASASIVASYHRRSLVPAAILMAMIGYALGNYCGYATALLCRWVLQS
jgi:uncharacterized membrane protein